MLYLCVAVLGLASSLTVPAAGLLLISTVIMVGTGIEGAIHHRALDAVLVRGIKLNVILQVAYAVPLLWAAVRPASFNRTRRRAAEIAAGIRAWRL